MKVVKRTCLGFIVSLGLIAIPSVVKASNWSLVVSPDTGSKYFVDLDSITRSGMNAKASVFVVYGDSSDGSVGYSATMEFSCTDNRSRGLQTLYLNSDGSSLRDGVNEWNTHESGTVGYSLNKKVCSYQ
jgi:hypothetical protein